MDDGVRVHRCPPCGAPLPLGEGMVVRCVHCGTDVHLYAEELAKWNAAVRDLEGRRLRSEEVESAVAPQRDQLTVEMNTALTEGRRLDALLLFAQVMRMHVAAPQIMVPEHDYEGTVVRPSVERFAADLGVDLGPEWWKRAG